jgi:hypothetical protein
MKNLTTETRRHGEKSGDRVIGTWGDRTSEASRGKTGVFTAEALRRGENPDAPGWDQQHRDPKQQVSGHDFNRAASGVNVRALALASFLHGPPRRSKANPAAAFWKSRLHRVLRIVLAALREIFDESAYERFLSRTGVLRSTDSYREFLREREIAMATKPRCC